MATLSKDLRRKLETAVLKARREAEQGARKALEQLAVHHHEPWGTMSAEERTLRNRLRAHGRQLGDLRDDRRGTQAITRLTSECAYEHWHRMLFARFLAECGALLEPGSGVAISIDECKELARERGVDWLELASSYAQRMLPQIFRSDDPVLELAFPPESRQELEALLAGLPVLVFLADDSLGWVYQFWQSDEKDRVNASGGKISADELPAVTQFFTEDYMVLFLLENTIGAWWAAKHLRAQRDLACSAQTEQELRRACSLPGYDWSYLRFVRAGDGFWEPAGGPLSGWPRFAREIRLLDPCMGSGHFLVFALSMLAAIRKAEEGLTDYEAVVGVLRDNLFGLEIDHRCTQIAAFNLALASWKIVGYRSLPPLNLACCGLGINAKEGEWVSLAGDDPSARNGMEAMYRLFQNAPLLGSLLNPSSLGGDLLQTGFETLRPLLAQALAQESTDQARHELAVTAQGLAGAGRFLADTFTLVVTNVPYLGREGHAPELVEFADRYFPDASADLSTLMLNRCMDFAGREGTVAVVLPQNWWVGTAYGDFRRRVLGQTQWTVAAVLGEEAWYTYGNRGPHTLLLVLEPTLPASEHHLSALDVSTKPGEPVVGLEQKALALAGEAVRVGTRQLDEVFALPQKSVGHGPHCRISVARIGREAPLSRLVESGEGCSTGDNDHYLRCFWEVDSSRWTQYCGPGAKESLFCDTSLVMLWDEGTGELAASTQARIQNVSLWSRRGVLVGRVRGLTATLFFGGAYSKGAVLVCPVDEDDLLPLLALLRSSEYETTVRTMDPRVSAATSVITDVPIDLRKWDAPARAQFGETAPSPESEAPSQSLFDGRPTSALQPLQVAVARMLGYRWPRQTGVMFSNYPSAPPDGLESLADSDGIVCLSALRGEAGAADRLGRILALAYGADWSVDTLHALLGSVGCAGRSLDEWLRDRFFEQHCDLFQQRPFVWHIWDGLKDGFAAMVNYHALAGSGGLGHRTLEKLVFAYLGDWIDRQKADQAAGVQGADARLAAAQHLKRELERVLEGNPPYDVFIRWKPLHEQPVGWDPDLNDGVRLNIRPFMAARPLAAKSQNACILRVPPKIKWQKDRGKEPQRSRGDYPWFWGWDQKTVDFAGGRTFDGNRWNDVHLTREFKLAARQRRGAS